MKKKGNQTQMNTTRYLRFVDGYGSVNTEYTLSSRVRLFIIPSFLLSCKNILVNYSDRWLVSSGRILSYADGLQRNALGKS